MQWSLKYCTVIILFCYACSSLGSRQNTKQLANDAFHADNRVTANEEISRNKKIAQQLDTIYLMDQKYRLLMMRETNIAKRNVLNIKMESADSSNRIKVTELITRYGWLSAGDIGERAEATIWMVLQHAHLEMHQKYYPIIKNAVAHGKARDWQLAYLEDRIAIETGKPQKYGTQLLQDIDGRYYLAPLYAPDSVNIYRYEVGLGSLTDYLAGFGIAWNLDSYKQELPKIRQLERGNSKKR